MVDFSMVAAVAIGALCASGPALMLVSLLPAWCVLVLVVAVLILCVRMYVGIPAWTAKQQRRTTVVLVTGGNRGIGLEVVRQLAEIENTFVYLAARDADAGQAALTSLRSKMQSGQSSRIAVLAIDVRDEKTIKSAVEAIRSSHGYLDILINNAGVSPGTGSADKNSREERERIVSTNFNGVFSMCDAFRDLLCLSTLGGHIINVGSRRGRLVMDTKLELKKHLGACACREDVMSLASDLVEGNEKWNGADTYGASKLLMHMATIILADEHQRAKTRVVVSSVCPGFVRTRMGGPMAPLSPAQGASAVVALALRDVGSLQSGLFWIDPAAQQGEKWSFE
eukprot:TRINITY_DN27121_c0_g1_i1.p1 TRINITY_DN27121_c0_g1~~TRINITY_DN27121_c0_g1_i1.p1  ORF type:complete len:353 (+),score=49.01 TRINITY_DN27121_c0_g1_i1:43-1059(+)